VESYNGIPPNEKDTQQKGCLSSTNRFLPETGAAPREKHSNIMIMVNDGFVKD
jgi:hypothetical protein